MKAASQLLLTEKIADEGNDGCISSEQKEKLSPTPPLPPVNELTFQSQQFQTPYPVEGGGDRSQAGSSNQMGKLRQVSW